MAEALEALEAVGVAAGELDVPLQVRQQDREVGGALRLDPRVLARRAGAGHLGAELGGDPAGLLPVAADDADQVGVDAVPIFAGLGVVELRARRLDQPPDLVVAEHLVADLGQGRELLGAGLAAGRRHHRALVPGEQRGGPAEVVDLAEALAEVLDRAHVATLGDPTWRGVAEAPRRRPAQGPRASAGAGGPSAAAAPAWRGRPSRRAGSPRCERRCRRRAAQHPGVVAAAAELVGRPGEALGGAVLDDLGGARRPRR